MKARLILAAGATALAAFAQVETVTLAQSGTPSGVPGGNVMFYHTEIAGSAKVVKGAPYSAQTITEHTQTLADGNSINQKQTGMFYRDSEGRTRREQALGPIGPVPADPEAPQLVFINDPVAGVSYVLNAAKKTAQKLPLSPPGAMVAGMAGGAGEQVSHKMATEGAVVVAHEAGMGPGPETRMSFRIKDGGEHAQQESLGTKVIEGVQAEGTRSTFTIPAGQIGNEKPITTVTERWFSPQLQATVLSTTTDPMMGQNTYRLTNITLAEPAANLFEVPADYAVTEGPGKGQMMYVSKPAK